MCPVVERVVQRRLEELLMCVDRCGVAEKAGSGQYVEDGSPLELEGERKMQAAMPVAVVPRRRCLEWQGKTWCAAAAVFRLPAVRILS